MNWSFVAISTPVKCNLRDLRQSLTVYLRLANIYNSNSNKKKTDLVEMIVYRCMINKISKEPIRDNSMNRALNILKKHGIYINIYGIYIN